MKNSNSILSNSFIVICKNQTCHYYFFYTSCFIVVACFLALPRFLTVLNATLDELGDLDRDAEPWRRVLDEISWGNNNKKEVAQTRVYPGQI